MYSDVYISTRKNALDKQVNDFIVTSSSKLASRLPFKMYFCFSGSGQKA